MEGKGLRTLCEMLKAKDEEIDRLRKDLKEWEKALEGLDLTKEEWLRQSRLHVVRKELGCGAA